jgi:hypothetical protein|tara:strand:- start:1109 stop:1324 length:216 start_codon:yes stop_codon:yes gene_type:complete
MKYSNMGQSLRVAQAMHGVTNIQLAAHFNVTGQQIIRWRNGTDMRIHRAEDMAKFFGMTLIKFIGLGNAKG